MWTVNFNWIDEGTIVRDRGTGQTGGEVRKIQLRQPHRLRPGRWRTFENLARHSKWPPGDGPLGRFLFSGNQGDYDPYAPRDFNKLRYHQSIGNLMYVDFMIVQAR